MRWRPTPTSVAASCFLVLATGCAVSPVYRYTPERLLEEAQLRAPDLRPHELVVPFEIDPVHVERARALLPRFADAEDTLTALLDALRDPEVFGLRYDWARTGDAQTTLDSHRGNCISLASVLIGLARGLGMRAYYAEATRVQEVTPDDDLRIWSGHMVAVIVIDGRRAFVDFSGQLPPDARYRQIDDLRALAHFYNNLGFQQMREAYLVDARIPWVKVRRKSEIATQIDPSFGPAWNNLGVALARMGDLKSALEMYRTALDVDPELRAAQQNLASLEARLAMIDEPGLGPETLQP